MMGRHPFAGRYLGQGDMPMDRAIAEYRFAYSARRTSTLMEAPPNVPTLADLPMGIADAFERAFGPSGPSGTRVSASEWAAILDRAEGELIQCASSAAHHYFRTAKTCPWCRMERAYPGFQAFVPSFPIHAGERPLDLDQLIAAVRAVTDPGPAPDLTTLMPVVVGQKPSARLAKERKMRFRCWLGGIIGITFASCLLILPGPTKLLGLLALVTSVVVGFFPSAAARGEREKHKRAQTLWNDAKRAFKHSADNAYYLNLRQDADGLIARLLEINLEEKCRVEELTSRKQELQLQHYLDQHDIGQAKLKGIGMSRTLTLKSYGIETAADVNYQRVVAISGFGPATANSLLAWRRRIESAFHFDPNQAIDPADIAAIKVDIATKRADLENGARETINKLQKAASDAVAIRANPGSEAMDAWTEWRNGQEAEKELRPSTREGVQLFAAGTVCAVSFLAYADLRFSSPRSLFGRQEQSSDGSITPQTGNAPFPQTTPNSTTDRPAEPARPSGPTAGEVPTSPAGEVPTSPQPPSLGGLNLLDRSNATRVQERLRFLGYFSNQPDGIWGSHSRAALRNFRRTKGLGGDDR